MEVVVFAQQITPVFHYVPLTNIQTKMVPVESVTLPVSMDVLELNIVHHAQIENAKTVNTLQRVPLVSNVIQRHKM
jgi:hypothetical protein